jgi:hypothetical protein
MQLKPPLFERVLRETDEDTDDFKKKLADLRKRVQRYRLTQYY